MKKLNLLALGLCMAALFSCGKDDSEPTPNPDIPGGGSQTEMAKISAVWEEHSEYCEKSTDGGNSWHVVGTTDHEKYKRESWVWDGKRPSSVTFRWGDYAYSDTYDFLYDEEGKLSKFIGDGEKYVMTYDGNRIGRMELFYDGEFYESIDLTYSNNKIMKMEATDDGENYLCEFVWSGNNLSKLISSEGDDVDFVSRFQSYDNGNNPYYGQDWVWPCLLGKNFGYEASKLSANNCTSSNIDGYLVTYEYSYNSKNYPTRVVETMIGEPDEYDGVLHRRKDITTYTYEYVE